jgi:short-subunit dehydrogenase
LFAGGCRRADSMSANETDDHGAIARRRRDTLVLITGASSGIGRATAERFAARGAHVLLLARREPRLREIVEDLAGRGASADYYPVDLADAGAVATVAERIKAEHGVPDIVVNNAGAGRWLPAVETSPDEARQMIELPYLAAFYVTRAFLPEMLARGHGHIACVTSPASYIVWPNACAYIAARHALKGFTEALRAELRGRHIDVTLVTLGTVSSSYWDNNPGSRQHLPAPPTFLLPELSTEHAAMIIVDAIERRRRRVVRPWFYTALIRLGLGR